MKLFLENGGYKVLASASFSIGTEEQIKTAASSEKEQTEASKQLPKGNMTIMTYIIISVTYYIVLLMSVLVVFWRHHRRSKKYPTYSEETKYDPNVPDSKKPWCSECGHTPYKITSGGHGNTSFFYVNCINCRTSMYIPFDNDINLFRLLLLGFSVPWFGGAVYAFFMLTLYGSDTGITETGKIVVPLLLLFVGLCFVAPYILFKKYYYGRRKQKWLTWAKERGYVEQT